MSSDPKGPDTSVFCTTCGRIEEVSFAWCLGHGWPKCCGHTMRMGHEPDGTAIDLAVGELFAPVQHVIRGGR